MDGKGKKNVKREKGVKGGKGGGKGGDDEGGGGGGKKKGGGDDDPDDMAKVLEQKQAGLAVNKQSALQTALEHISIEMGKGMPNFSRGPEIEIASIKDVEDLKHLLAQRQIHVDFKVLQRAIIMPKDLDTTGKSYPSCADRLVKDPNADEKNKKKGKGGKAGRKRK